MDNNLQIENTLADQLAKIIDETLLSALHHEVKIYTELSKTIGEQLSHYASDTDEIVKENSISGYFFESSNTTNSIKKLLEENTQLHLGSLFFEALKKFGNQSLIVLNVENTESGASEADAIKAEADKKKNDKKFWKLSLKKKPVKPKEEACYLYFYLIQPIFKDHFDKIDKFEKSRLALLLNLWDKSKLIENNISVLSRNNYQLELAKNELVLSVSKEDTMNLIEVHLSEADSFVQLIKKSINEAFEIFENDKNPHYATILKNRRKYKAQKVSKSILKIENDFSNFREKWFNTILALSDDWLLDLEISALKCQILKGYFSFAHYVENKYVKPLDEKVKIMRASTEAIISDFKAEINTAPEDVIKRLNKIKSDVRRKLVLRLLPEIREVLLNSEIPKEIDEFEKNTIKQFASLSKSKVLIRNPIYDHAVEQTDLKKISPNDLVSFDIQPDFMVVFPSMKNAIIRQIQNLKVKLEEIPEIVDYSIESAIGYFEDKRNLTEAIKIGSEGINRTLNKIDDLAASREDFYSNEIDFLKNKIDQLIEKFSEITDNESALQIKFRVTKAKAIQQSKALRDKVFKGIVNFIPRVFVKFRLFYRFVIVSSLKIKSQLEGEDKKGFISTDVSDYLAETEEAINRLPFVYQRLFQIKPLTNFDLYIERKEHSEKLIRAYSRWVNGKFAPTIVIGEKGSGKTSFINRFQSLKIINEKVIYIDLFNEYIEPHVAFLKIYESIPEFSEPGKDKIAEKPKRIIVVDGLEKLFEAKIDGFIVLQKMMKLISETNQNIFWIFTCNLFSYNYLEKSFNISEYFGYHIQLEDLTSEKLISIIERRHNISGFRLNFLPASQKKSFIPLLGHSDNKSQAELKKQYFDKLLKIVNGNITQAFLHWTRSASEVTEDIIYMNVPGDKTLDFVKSISLAKFVILRNIIIHNGLSADKHSEIFRIPFENSELQLEQMRDDGIIIKQSEIYNINPMIYKQVVDQMFNLNLLH